MDILVAILVVALIVAVVFAVVQRRPAGTRGLGRPRTSPIGRRRGVPRDDPMAAAVAEHAAATDPHDAVLAEQRLRAEARNVAAPLQAEANRVEHQRAADQLGQRGPLPGDPAVDAGVDAAPDPAYGDPRSDPAPDPRYDDRAR